jgi:mannitol-1-/sugar-/sorbitol-6-phosphatase
MPGTSTSTQAEGTPSGGDRLDRTGLGAVGERTFDAVLFDLDGTLIDSAAAVRRSWLTWADEHGLDPTRLQGYHGVQARQIVQDLVPQHEVGAASARIDELELLDVQGIVPLPGAAEALAALPVGRSAVVTSCTARLAAVRLGAAALAVPQVLVTADDVTAGKPDPEPFRLGAERLGVDPARCLVVEDAPSGLAAGRAAGSTTLAVRTTTPADQLEADAVVGSLADVVLRVGPDGVRVAQRN